jgi:hypothetical protein
MDTGGKGHINLSRRGKPTVEWRSLTVQDRGGSVAGSPQDYKSHPDITSYKVSITTG